MTKRLSALMAVLLLLMSPLARSEDLKEIQARGELRHLGIRYANFVTGAGDGLDVEITKGFAEYIGVKYRLVYSDFYSIIQDLLGRKVAVKSGQATLSSEEFPVKGDMIATGFTVLPWREQILLYSDAVFPTQVLLVAKANDPQRPVAGQNLATDIEATKAMIGKKSLLVMKSTCLDPAGYGLDRKGIDLRPYTRNTNINEMVPAMLNGVADYTLLDVADVVLDLQKWAGHIKILGPISIEQNMAAAFPQDAPQLRDEFNEYLRKIRADGTYMKLVRKYYPTIESYFPEFFAKVR